MRKKTDSVMEFVRGETGAWIAKGVLAAAVFLIAFYFNHNFVSKSEMWKAIVDERQGMVAKLQAIDDKLSTISNQLTAISQHNAVGDFELQTIKNTLDDHERRIRASEQDRFNRGPATRP